MDLLLLFDKYFLKKKHLCSHLQYANSVDKKYEEKNGTGFVRKCPNKARR
jgi:hypothetical protein